MSAERWFGPAERQALALAVACSGCFAIDLGPDDPPITVRSSARYIQEFCEDGRYELEGSAERTEGLTSDSCGFSVGPSAGVVRFLVGSDSFTGTSEEYEALVAREDGSDPNWIPAPSGSQGSTTFFEVYPEAGNKKRRVIDVRFRGELHYDTPGCAIRRTRRGHSR